MIKITKKVILFLFISIFCMTSSSMAYAGFLDDLKNEAKKLEEKIKEKTKTPDKKKLTKEEKQQKKKEAVKKKQAARDKKKADRKAAKLKDEEAEWQAAVAEEKAKKANKELAEAEHEIYQEDIDIAVKENEKLKEQARKKDDVERVKEHDHKSAEWHIAHKGVEPFKKSLYVYEVDGLSLGMSVSALEKALVNKGYERTFRKIIRGNPKYIYKKGKESNPPSVEIKSAGFDGIPNSIIISLRNTDGEKMIAEETIRMLNKFSGTCNMGRAGDGVYCYKYTKTNELSIGVNFTGKQYVKYSIKNIPSSKAR